MDDSIAIGKIVDLSTDNIQHTSTMNNIDKSIYPGAGVV